jgi:hypothetical protein
VLWKRLRNNGSLRPTIDSQGRRDIAGSMIRADQKSFHQHLLPSRRDEILVSNEV